MKNTYYFIVNSKARTGKGIAVWNELESILKGKNVQYKVYRTAHAGHAKELAAKITSMDEERKIIIVGGDGTVNEVLNGVRDFSKVKFGYIPIGSANDFARGLGILDVPVGELLERIFDESDGKCIDIGKVYGDDGVEKLFGISCGIGIDAEVCKAALTSKLKNILNVFHLGVLTYKLLTVHKLFTMPQVRCEIQLDGNEKKKIKKGIFACAMNTPWEGGGVPMAPKATPYDEKLSLCCVHGYSKLQAFFIFPSLLSGTHENKRGFWHDNFTRADIYFEKPMTLHYDGEYGGEHTHIVIESLPGHMQFL